MSCRFYSNRYPEVIDVFMVNVRIIGDVGTYVHFLKYNYIEGLILSSELSRYIRAIIRVIRDHKTYP